MHRCPLWSASSKIWLDHMDWDVKITTTHLISIREYYLVYLYDRRLTGVLVIYCSMFEKRVIRVAFENI